MVLFLMVIMIIPLAFAEGITVKSVSYVPYNGNNNVTIYFTINGGGQSLTGTWYGQELPEGTRLEQPIKIKVSNQKETITYPYLNQGALYKYRAYYKDAEDKFSGAICKPKPAYCFPVDLDAVRFFGWDRVLIIEKVPAGQYARFGEGEISSTVQLSITVNGTEYTQNIGSGQESRGSATYQTYDNQWIGNAIWTGLTMTGRALPNPNNYIGTHVLGEKGQVTTWQISPLVNYEQYTKSLTETDSKLSLLSSSLVDGFDDAGASWKTGYQLPDICKDSLCSDVVNIVTVHNSIVDKLTDQSVHIDYRAPTAQQVTQVNEGNVIDTLNTPIGNGEIVLTLSADKIGVIQTSGIPEITNISIQSSASGDNDNSMLVNIHNAGNDKATFGIRINGSIEQKITLDSGASGQAELPFVGNEGLNSGVVEVYDIATGNSATQAYEVSVSAPKKFIPNSTEVYNDVVIKSDSTGMNQTIGKECKGIWQFKDSKYHCIKFKDIAEPAKVTKEQLYMAVPTATPEPPYEGNDGYYLWLLVVFLIGIIFAAFMGQAVSSRGGRKNALGALTVLLILAVISAIIIVVALYGNALITKIDEIQFMMNISEKLR
jgi:hypothetical protein